MSQLLITQYLKNLDVIKKVSGSQRESIVREAFKDLLKSWGKQQELVFLAEYPLKTATNTNISVDGALLHELRMPLGYWEAKDANDDLEKEIVKKFKKGYPQDNILFSDDAKVILWQNRREVARCDVLDVKSLSAVIKLFFAFQRPEIANFRAAVAQFKADMPAVLSSLRTMIDKQEQSNAKFRAASAAFLKHAQEAINPSLAEADVREMLIQHILTEEIFAKVFDDSDFHQHNNVARELYALEAVFFTGTLKKQTLKGLEPYYAAIRAGAAQIASHNEKQNFLKVIYENFYKVYNQKAADRLGVVYTPNEVVRFMIEGADWLCEQNFDKNLIDKGVDILDPATGTGTYICELMEHFRGQKKKLEYKYKNELHANEVAILPYYVANLNIEATYAAITGEYDEFTNLCFVDTLDNVGLHTSAKGTTADLFGGVSEENVARIRRQNQKKISVIIGNPPYYANQANENDNNKTRKYPVIDTRIKETYIAKSNAQKTKGYDMYRRFFRWASDRVSENGIIAFITNNNFIDAKEADGLRKVIAEEFNYVYVIDLKGNARTIGDRRRKEGGNIFDDQIRVGVAIWFCVKNEAKKGCRIFYEAAKDYASADEKMAFLSGSPLSERKLDQIKPDKKANWIDLADNDFDELLPLAASDTKASRSAAQERAIFKLYSNGINTARDGWVVDKSVKHLGEKVKYFLKHFSTFDRSESKYDTKIKWSRNLKVKLRRGQTEAFKASNIIGYSYRPFCANFLYQSELLLDEQGQIPAMMRGENRLIALPAAGEFRCLATERACDFHFIGDSRVISLYRYGENGARVSNVTDWAAKQFDSHYKSELAANKNSKKITKDQIFYYCYAVLHNPIYREKYARNLKREFPSIPFYEDFFKWADWGRTLADLHCGYETAEAFPLIRTDVPDKQASAAGLSPRVLLKARPSEGIIIIDSETSLSGIPPKAWDYKVGSRSALEWVLDQYEEKRINDETLQHQFNNYKFLEYKEDVIDLLMRLSTVSVRTAEIVAEMQEATQDLY